MNRIGPASGQQAAAGRDPRQTPCGDVVSIIGGGVLPSLQSVPALGNHDPSTSRGLSTSMFVGGRVYHIYIYIYCKFTIHLGTVNMIK